MDRHFFGKLSQKSKYVQTHCNKLNDLFHLAYRKRYLYNFPHC